MKTIFFLCASLTLLGLTACKGKDRICTCIDATTKLNTKVTHVLRKTPTAADEKELKALRGKKKKWCSEFEHMAGPEMLERKQSCKQ